MLLTESGLRSGACGVEPLVDERLMFTDAVYDQQQISPYFDPTYTRTGWIGQPPVLDRHEVVTIDGDVVTLRQATP